jgi:hypothetical protein
LAQSLPEIRDVAQPTPSGLSAKEIHCQKDPLEVTSMKIANILAAAALGAASISLTAQQPAASEPQPTSPPPLAAEQTSPAAQPSYKVTTSGAAATEAMSPVKRELVDKLDSKTAKAGDNVVIKTQSTMKTADGTEIPKGSKLIGHVTGVKPSGSANENSQVALQFDRAELKSGQSLPIHSELQSLSPSDSGSNAGVPDTMASAPPTVAPGGMNGGPAGSATPGAPTQPQMGDGGAASANNPNPGVIAGTIVARTGNIAIRTTSIPGVLLASNEPGQQDPRMAESSGILLGPKHDVHLDGGTKVVIRVAAAGANATGN